MIAVFQHDMHASRVLVLLAHPEVRVRLAAVTALSNLDSMESSDEFCAALQDTSAEVRIAAAAGLALHGDLGALPTLREKLQRREFSELATAESRGIMVAYAKLGQAESVPLLDWMLNKRRFLRHRMPAHVRIGAAQALTYIDHPEAQRALRKSLRDRNLVVQSIVRSAMRNAR